jgi:hypothetical protein
MKAQIIRERLPVTLPDNLGPNEAADARLIDGLLDLVARVDKKRHNALPIHRLQSFHAKLMVNVLVRRNYRLQKIFDGRCRALGITVEVVNEDSTIC